MKTRAAATSLIIATLLLGAPPLTPTAAAQTAPAQLNDHVLPVAAGALIGAAVSFFVLPWIIPATAVTAIPGASTTASPLIAVVGAGVGSIIGYEMGP